MKIKLIIFLFRNTVITSEVLSTCVWSTCPGLLPGNAVPAAGSDTAAIVVSITANQVTLFQNGISSHRSPTTAR